MRRYITTNLRLSPESYEGLMLRANRRNTTMAALVREAVEAYLGAPVSTAMQSAVAGAATSVKELDPLDGFIGCVKGGPSDESVNHDHYLYGLAKDSSGETLARHKRAPRPAPEKRPTPRRRR